jgi:hypothetical protein
MAIYITPRFNDELCVFARTLNFPDGRKVPSQEQHAPPTSPYYHTYGMRRYRIVPAYSA